MTARGFYKKFINQKLSELMPKNGILLPSQKHALFQQGKVTRYFIIDYGNKVSIHTPVYADSKYMYGSTSEITNIDGGVDSGF